MLMQDYGISENFFKEIDASVKKHCRTQNDVQGYLFMYQGFSNDLMMLMGNLMQWKFRMPSIFKGALRSMTEKTVHEVCTKAVWKKDDVHKTAMTVRQYKERLGYSESLCWQRKSRKRKPTNKRKHKPKFRPISANAFFYGNRTASLRTFSPRQCPFTDAGELPAAKEAVVNGVLLSELESRHVAHCRSLIL